MYGNLWNQIKNEIKDKWEGHWAETKFRPAATKKDLKKSETRMTAGVLKQDPNTWKVQKNAVYGGGGGGGELHVVFCPNK